MAIIKILPRKSLGGLKSLLSYIQNHDKGKDGKLHQILHNVRSKDVTGQVREFLNNEANRKTLRSDSKRFLHEIISFSPSNREQITPEIMENIARKYISLRGSKALMVGAVHLEGKDHCHLHFCTSAIELISGKSTDIPKKELHRIKTELQSFYLEKYPFLAPSKVRHGLGREYTSQKEYQLKLRTDRTSKKEEITRTVRACFDVSKTQNEFLERLQEAGLPHYERKEGIAQGVISGNIKFRFSRMDIPIHELPFDRTADELALEEIRRIREAQKTKDRHRKIER